MVFSSAMDLVSLNKRGLIPGPQESSEEFYKRVEGAVVREQPFPEALDRLEALYDVRPDWVEVSTGKGGLTPWQGGAAWGAKIRVRPSKLYSENEVVAHEMAHACRLAFEEPKFEEHLAFRTSERAWRRALGPVVQRPWEVYLFMGSALASLWFPLVPMVGVCGVGLARLARGRRALRRALQWASWPILFRLTDREILELSLLSDSERTIYIGSQKSLRWEQIRICYFS